MTVRFHETALRDIEHIRDRVAEDNPEAAKAVLERIDRSITLLDEFNDIGRAGIVSGTREKPVPRTPYVVVYELAGPSEIWILTIVHGRQRYPPEA